MAALTDFDWIVVQDYLLDTEDNPINPKCFEVLRKKQEQWDSSVDDSAADASIDRLTVGYKIRASHAPTHRVARTHTLTHTQTEPLTGPPSSVAMVTVGGTRFLNSSPIVGRHSNAVADVRSA
ncbi:hypothetical protein J6590_010867 [Homalodisca vitripennis]|nr:hypothetical protein J6590_010867 [Homalodisca vitripennis]